MPSDVGDVRMVWELQEEGLGKTKPIPPTKTANEVIQDWQEGFTLIPCFGKLFDH